MPVTYKKIASVTVGSGGAANIEFTSIPGTYTDLIIKTSLRSDAGVTYNNVRLSFNGSGGTAYSARLVYGDGTSALSASESGLAFHALQYTAASSATASTFSNNDFYIPKFIGG
jgi:hypothetical protein